MQGRSGEMKKIIFLLMILLSAMSIDTNAFITLRSQGDITINGILNNTAQGKIYLNDTLFINENISSSGILGLRSRKVMLYPTGTRNYLNSSASVTMYGLETSGLTQFQVFALKCTLTCSTQFSNVAMDLGLSIAYTGAGINGKAVQITSPTTNLIIIGDSLIPSSGQNLILGNSSQAFRWANVYTYNVTNYRTTYTGALQVANRTAALINRDKIHFNRSVAVNSTISFKSNMTFKSFNGTGLSNCGMYKSITGNSMLVCDGAII